MTEMTTTHEAFERDLAADARAYYLQRAFRALLHAFARPGEVLYLDRVDAAADDASRSGLYAPAVVLSDVLLDAATSVAVAGASGGDAERVLASRSHARPVRPSEAAFVFVPASVRGAAAASAVAAATPGTLVEPHRGATMVVECATLLGVDAHGVRTGSAASDAPASAWSLAGPGIKGTHELVCDRADVLAARNDRGDEFPCGIDIVLVDGAGHIAAVPRSTTLELMAENMQADGGAPWAM